MCPPRELRTVRARDDARRSPGTMGYLHHRDTTPSGARKNSEMAYRFVTPPTASFSLMPKKSRHVPQVRISQPRSSSWRMSSRETEPSQVRRAPR